jgi:hypothetical protein
LTSDLLRKPTSFLSLTRSVERERSIFAGEKTSLLQAVLKCKMNEKLHGKRGVANDIAAPLFYYALFN